LDILNFVDPCLSDLMGVDEEYKEVVTCDAGEKCVEYELELEFNGA